MYHRDNMKIVLPMPRAPYNTKHMRVGQLCWVIGKSVNLP